MTGETIEVEEDGSFLGTKKGVNIPFTYKGEISAVIGISGEPVKVRKYAYLAQKITTLLLLYHELDQQEHHQKTQLNQVIRSLIYKEDVNPDYLADFLKKFNTTPNKEYHTIIVKLNSRYHPSNLFLIEKYIYRAFEQMVLQYQAAHPEKKIMVLTEFVSDRLFPWQLPGKPVGRLEMPWRRNDKDFAFFSHFLRAGIEIIGLENNAYIKEHEALITPSDCEAESVCGMQERNAHWRRIISYVADKNPHAVLFIYTGSMHSHYRAPFSLATPSPQNIVFQLESRQLGLDMPFGFVMHQEPFVRATSQTATVLTWKDQTSVFRTRSGFDVAIIFPGENE